MSAISYEVRAPNRRRSLLYVTSEPYQAVGFALGHSIRDRKGRSVSVDVVRDGERETCQMPGLVAA